MFKLICGLPAGVWLAVALKPTRSD